MLLTIKRALVAIVLMLSLAAPVAYGTDASQKYMMIAQATAIDATIETFMRRMQKKADADLPQTVPFVDEIFPPWIEDVHVASKQRDYSKVLSLLMSHVTDGNGIAQHMLGDMYEKGEGVPQDYVRAHMWLNLAAAKGSPGAAVERATLEFTGRMTPAQIAEAQKLAREWLKAHPEPPR